jgi:hypothetical protein
MQTAKDQELWKIAKKRVGFKRHLASYIVINSFLWLLWFFTDKNEDHAGIPWPIFPMLGWGVGLMFSFLRAYVFITRNAIEKEYNKLKGNK